MLDAEIEGRMVGAIACRLIGDIGRDRRGFAEKSGRMTGRMRERRCFKVNAKKIEDIPHTRIILGKNSGYHVRVALCLSGFYRWTGN